MKPSTAPAVTLVPHTPHARLNPNLGPPPGLARPSRIAPPKGENIFDWDPDTPTWEPIDGAKGRRLHPVISEQVTAYLKVGSIFVHGDNFSHFRQMAPQAQHTNTLTKRKSSNGNGISSLLRGWGCQYMVLLMAASITGKIDDFFNQCSVQLERPEVVSARVAGEPPPAEPRKFHTVRDFAYSGGVRSLCAWRC